MVKLARNFRHWLGCRKYILLVEDNFKFKLKLHYRTFLWECLHYLSGHLKIPHLCCERGSVKDLDLLDLKRIVFQLMKLIDSHVTSNSVTVPEHLVDIDILTHYDFGPNPFLLPGKWPGLWDISVSLWAMDRWKFPDVTMARVL